MGMCKWETSAFSPRSYFSTSLPQQRRSYLEHSNMKNIKVLGSGCRNCEVTAKVIAQAAREAGVEIELEKVTDLQSIMAFGVLATPGVVVDGQVVHSGGIPGPEKVRAWMSD